MPNQALLSNLAQALAFVAPKMSKQETFFLKGAFFLRSSFLLYRKLTYVRDKKTAISFTMGTIVGSHPTVQQIARFIFGSLSLIKCTKDLYHLKSLHRRCRRILAGKHYVTIKGDRFNLKCKKGISPSTMDRLRWKKNLKMARIKAFFATVKEIFKTLGKLTWHLSDGYTAFNDKHSGSIVVHSHQLWNELNAQDTTFLLKKLKKSRALNDWLLQKRGLAMSTKLLIQILKIPSKVAPLHKEIKGTFQGIIEEVEEGLIDFKTKWNQWQGLEKDYLIEEPALPKEFDRFISSPSLPKSLLLKTYSL